MKKLVCWLLAVSMLLSLCACGASSAPTATAAPEAAEIPAPEVTEAPAVDPMALYRTGAPWICSDLEGVVTEEMNAELKDDFALYINRDFYINAEIPEGYYAVGGINSVNILNVDETVQLFADGNDYSERDSMLAKSLYDLQLDWDARNKLGVEPLKEKTDCIESVKTLDELISYYMNCPVEQQLDSPFAVFADVDLDNPESYIVWIDSPSLILDDSAEYSELTELGALYLNAYRDLAEAMLMKLGYSEERAQEIWDEAYRFEELMAPYIYTSEEMNSPDYLATVNNHMTRDELFARQGRMPIAEFAELSCGFGIQENFLVLNPGFVEAMQGIFSEENLQLIKSWIICSAAIGYSGRLDRECYELKQACNFAITGASSLPDDVLAALSTQNILGWQTAKMYCDKYFTQQDKDDIKEIIDSIIAAYKDMLLTEDFISEETKATAIRKLENLRIRNLYPDDWSKYADPELSFKSPAEGGSLVAALDAISVSSLRQMQERMKNPVDHERWEDYMVPTVVNCFYSMTDNSINILAAFCRGELYDRDMSYEEKCGKIGIVVGHEITHAFDSEGAQFDENGYLTDWWTAEDKALFEEKNQKLADYYSNMSYWDGENMLGSIMTGESCADMGAMKCLLSIAATKDAFDYDAFFKSYAEIWRTKMNMYVALMFMKDPHPMGYVRINSVLQQFDEFLDFYGITEGDNMYLAPEDRVAIW